MGYELFERANDKNEIKLVMKDRYHEIKFSPTITKAYIGAFSDKFT